MRAAVTGGGCAGVSASTRDGAPRRRVLGDGVDGLVLPGRWAVLFGSAVQRLSPVGGQRSLAVQDNSIIVFDSFPGCTVVADCSRDFPAPDMGTGGIMRTVLSYY